MAYSRPTDEICADSVKNILVEAGFETTPGVDETCFFVKDPEGGLTFTCDLENDILYNTVCCVEIEERVLTPDMMRILLDAENGISTSSFQTIKKSSGTLILTLNNFCKLQDLGPEDKDDILSCLEFLNLDVLAARDLLSSFL